MLDLEATKRKTNNEKRWKNFLPAHPTVAAPAPMNLAACSISRFAAEVWNPAGTMAYSKNTWTLKVMAFMYVLIQLISWMEDKLDLLDQFVFEAQCMPLRFYFA